MYQVTYIEKLLARWLVVAVLLLVLEWVLGLPISRLDPLWAFFGALGAGALTDLLFHRPRKPQTLSEWSAQNPAPQVIVETKGVQRVGGCLGCDARWDSYARDPERAGEVVIAEAKAHARQTGHKTWVTTTMGAEYEVVRP